MYDTNFVQVLPESRPDLDDEPRFTQVMTEYVERRIREICKMDLTDLTGRGSRLIWGYSNPLDFCLGVFSNSILRDFVNMYFQWYGLNAEESDYVWLSRFVATKIPDMRKKLEEALFNTSLR